MRWAGVVLVAGWVGCASPGDDLQLWRAPRVQLPEGEAAPTAPRPATRAVSYEDHAQSFRNADLCEQGARELRGRKPKRGWALLAACTARPDFTLIDRALREPWIEDIKRRPRSGAQLVANIIANRGGNLVLDLGLVNERGVQLFDLETVMRHDKIFRGRYVLMRARVHSHARRGPAHRLELAETSLRAQNITEVWSRQRVAEARHKGQTAQSLLQGDEAPERRIVVESHNISHETERGLTVFSEHDPQVKEGEEHLFLVRFEELSAPSELTGPRGVGALVRVYRSRRGLP